ncbi:peroxidase family protein [Caulobacter sp. 1776]|uniref:peroxidase family protein n=1 Tax=Caulobacter sp. 1776 TaxID=3156420 RepID=UPI0033954C10
MLAWIIAALEPVVAWLTERWPAFHRLVNGLLINGIVSETRPRPHPWSTKTPYISWAALTDRTYSARQLPAKDPGPLPDAQMTTAVFARPAGRPQISCAKSTMLFPAFAQYLTDGFIRTMVFNDREDRRRTTSNHEIDLCTLYGRTEAQTNALRLRSPSQRGRLKSQTINGEEYPPALYDAEGGLLAEFVALDPPLGVDNDTPLAIKRQLFALGGDRANSSVGTMMMGTLFLREHNRLAGVIAAAHADWDDDRVFETARNVVIVLYIKLVVEEYINHISPSRIRLLADPTDAWKRPWNKPNWITAEFSLLYRWHSLVSEDITWAGQPTKTATLRFAGDQLTRHGLASAYVWMSAQPAALLGAGNTADYLQDVEARAINQARLNQIAPYNAYRAANGMKPVTTFEEISTRPGVADKLRTLYGHVDKVEFYVGLFAEDTAANAPLPPLILRMVAIDAFSQALTNPLLSRNIWGDPANRLAAFTREGLAAIESAKTLRDLLVRNGADPGSNFVGMTRPEWKRNAKVQRVG